MCLTLTLSMRIQRLSLLQQPWGPSPFVHTIQNVNPETLGALVDNPTSRQRLTLWWKCRTLMLPTRIHGLSLLQQPLGSKLIPFAKTLTTQQS